MTDVPDLPDLIPADPTPAPEPMSQQEAHDLWVHAPATPEAPRNEDGTFAAATPPDAPPASPDPATEPPAPPAEDPAQFIEAKVGEEMVKLRKDTLIPTKRNGQVEYEPLEVVQRERMLKKDYDLGKQELKAERQRMAAERVELQHRAAAFEAEEARLKGALTSPEAFDNYQEHLRLMQTNETYRATFERAQRATEYEAASAANQSVQEQAIIADAVEQTTAWMAAAVERHPGVDLQESLREFGRALATKQPGVEFSPEAIEAFIARKAQPAQALLTPLQQQLEAQQAKMAALEAELAALRSTKTTDHALRRAGTVSTAPVGGAAPVPGAKGLVTPNGARDLTSMTEAWRKA